MEFISEAVTEKVNLGLGQVFGDPFGIDATEGISHHFNYGIGNGDGSGEAYDY